MSKPTHTPGPWFQRLTPQGQVEIYSHDAHPDGAVLIARVGFFQTDANANLLASAPDLLAVARIGEDALGYALVDAPLKDKDTLGNALDVIKKAIARAEGRSDE